MDRNRKTKTRDFGIWCIVFMRIFYSKAENLTRNHKILHAEKVLKQIFIDTSNVSELG